jgi:hypothetical protein
VVINLIIAVDFDGTIVKEQYPNIGRLRLGAKKVLLWLKKRGHTLILNTCRTEKYLNLASWHCATHLGFMFDAYNENIGERIKQYGGDCRKISADLYLDDKGFFPGWWAVPFVVLWMERKEKRKKAQEISWKDQGVFLGALIGLAIWILIIIVIGVMKLWN